jgi:sortase A
VAHTTAGNLARQRQRPDVRSVIGVTGEVLITLGVIVFLFLAYELWFTGLYTAHAQSDLKKQLFSEWNSSAPITPGQTASPTQLPGEDTTASAAPQSPPAFVDEPVPGDALAIIRIPRLGTHYAYAVVEGVSTSDLKKGPGHYPGSAMPGQTGNFVLSGHRTTYLAPFNGLDKLSIGDAIVIETRDTWYTYRVTGSQTVLPTDVNVILPVPDKPGAKPTQALITLTTCTPKYSASHRLIIFGTLDSTLPKADGTPPALAGS